MSAWQDFIALVIVGVAAGYLARIAWRTFASKKPGCNSCGSCSANKQPPDKLVSIEPMKRMR